MRIVFPTKEKMSYISHSAKSFKQAEYLTVLSVKGQNIISVEIVKNYTYKNDKEFLKELKNKQYSVIIVPSSEGLVLKELKNIGISVFINKDSQVVLNSFSDFLQDKLQRA